MTEASAPSVSVVDERRGLALPLADGTPMFYAPVTRRDEWRLREGVRELSPESRYLRFFSPLTELSEKQVQYFSTPDQRDHVAWGALAVGEPRVPGVGIGRMVRDANDPAAAEFAVAVVDRYQGRGVGTALMAILCAAALRRGIAELQAMVLPDNRRVLEWFANLGAWRTYRGDYYDVRLAVAEIAVGGPGRLPRLIEALRPVVDEVESTA